MTDKELQGLCHELKALCKVQHQDIIALESQIKETSSEIDILDSCNKFLSEQIKDKVSDAKYQLESLVNQGLKFIFGENLRIDIQPTFKNNKTQFSLNIIKDGINEGQSDAFGGGVLSVISLLLRVSAIIIDKTERLLVLDETTAFVSKQYQPLVSQFLQKICEQLNFTIILIAHQQDVATYADNIYQAIGDAKNGTTFKKISFDEF